MALVKDQEKSSTFFGGSVRGAGWKITRLFVCLQKNTKKNNRWGKTFKNSGILSSENLAAIEALLMDKKKD